LLDNAGAVNAWRIGEAGKAGVFARTDIGVNGIDAGGVKADADLARRGG
jgi:hypothetical protein